LAPGPWWTHDHGMVQPLRGSEGHCDSSKRERERERERRSLGFSPMAAIRGEAAEMATRRCSIEAGSGAPTGRCFKHEERLDDIRQTMEGGQSVGGRQRRWNLNGTSYGRWKWGRGGNVVWPFSDGKTGRRRGDFTVLEVDETVKSSAAAVQAQGGG
jgi:hypothetical protein